VILLAAVVGYLIGSIPTAAYIARLWGVDLLRVGSGNPGTRNALATGGPLLAAAVLVVEAAKGYVAVWLGDTLAGDSGAIAAGVAAVGGNVYNVWYRFQGGKGLGISLGVVAGAWPTVLPVMVLVIVVVVVVTRSAGLAALAAIAGFVMCALLWPARGWPTGGHAATGPELLVLALGLTAIMARKHWRDSPLNPEWRSSRRARESPGHH
jgi:glycerol-3-phosphate acyltransferase PlsY